MAIKAVAIGRTGRGDWGHAIDETVATTPGVDLVAVADESADGLAAAVARHGLDAGMGFRDWRAMLADVKPDLVAICMRHVDCHAEMAIAAVEAGARGVFMEKPFVRTRTEAEAVIAACRAAHAKLGLAYVNRHAPSYAAVRDLVADGRIGRVLELRARGKEDQRGGGEDLVVLGCHVLDLMADLGGSPQWCQASVTVAGRPITAADAVDGPEGIGRIAGDSIAATFGLADGPIGSFASVRDAGHKQPNFGLTIAGTTGAIHIRPDHVPQAWLREAPLWRTDKDVPWRPIGPQGLDGPPPAADVDRAVERMSWGRLDVADLVAAIAEDREPETGMYAGRTTVEMIAAVYAAALSGRRVEWPLPENLPTLG